MSDANALLEELGHRNVEVWLDAGQLRYRAPRGTMTPELKARLVVHKQAVMSLLGARPGPAANEEHIEGRNAAHNAAHSDEPFPLTELAHAYLLGHAAFAELGDLPAQIYLEFELPRLDLDRLTRAAARLIARHDALRVVVLPDGSQRVARDPAPLVIAREDLTGRSRDELAAARLALRRRMSSGAVDPFRGPPFAVTRRAATMAGS